jgi:hypothetical protein
MSMENMFFTWKTTYFCLMRSLVFHFWLLISVQVAIASSVGVQIPVTGSVKVWFPEEPKILDTLGQQVYYHRDGNEMMVCTVAPISEDILSADTFNMDRLINNFINDIVSGANVLILSDVSYKNLPAKYYKIRVDNEFHPLHGLMLDSYTLPVSDTVYNFAYWRFNATEIYDYSRQRTFYDKVEIARPAEVPAAETSMRAQETEYKTPRSRWFFPFVFVLCIAVAGLAYLLYRQRQKA